MPEPTAVDIPTPAAPEKCYCDFRQIQKIIVLACYLVFLMWSYLKLQFEHDEEFQDVAKKIDIGVAVGIGILLRMSYNLKETLREVSTALSPEMSQRFESMFVLNKQNQGQLTRIATDLQRLGVPRGDPFADFEMVETIDTARESVHMIDLDDGRRVEIRIPRAITAALNQ